LVIVKKLKANLSRISFVRANRINNFTRSISVSSVDWCSRKISCLTKSAWFHPQKLTSLRGCPFIIGNGKVLQSRSLVLSPRARKTGVAAPAATLGWLVLRMLFAAQSQPSYWSAFGDLSVLFSASELRVHKLLTRSLDFFQIKTAIYLRNIRNFLVDKFRPSYQKILITQCLRYFLRSLFLSLS